MRKSYLLIAAVILLIGVVSSAGVWRIPSGTAEAHMTLWVAGGGTPGGADTTPPTVSGSPTIGTDGETVTINFTETVVTTGYDNGDFDLDCTTAGNGISLNSISGSGSERTFTAASTIDSGDTCNLDYTGGADEIEDAAGNDLATFSDTSTTNNSTQGAVAFPNTAVLDDFNRETFNSTGYWTTIQGGFSIYASTQAIGTSSAALNGARWNYSTYADGWEVYCTYDSIGSDYISLAFLNASFNGYNVVADGDAQEITISVVTAGVPSQLGAAISATIADGDSVGLKKSGSTLTAYHKSSGGSWAEVGSRTDSTYSTSGYFYMSLYDSSVMTDNFGGGNP